MKALRYLTLIVLTALCAATPALAAPKQTPCAKAISQYRSPLRAKLHCLATAEVSKKLYLVRLEWLDGATQSMVNLFTLVRT